jgi:ferredoxin
MKNTGSEYMVCFDSGHPPLRLPQGANLSEHLTIENSPVLFGCRTGICGTCRSSVQVLNGGQLEPQSEDELNLLGIVCPGHPTARLACQINLTADIKIAPLKDGNGL